jgi:Helix-turn-helix domain
MLVQRAYKTELDLNDRQVTACRQHACAARWAYSVKFMRWIVVQRRAALLTAQHDGRFF